jgi:ribosomal protein S20
MPKEDIERLPQEIAAASSKSEARAIIKNYAKELDALGEAAREEFLAEIQDTIAQLPN